MVAKGTGFLGSDPSLATAVELVNLYRRNRLTPVDVLEAVAKRIRRLDPTLNSFVILNPHAKAEAEASAKRWRNGQPLGAIDGVPCTVKDVMDLAGTPTRHGSLLTSSAVAADDAPIPRNIKAAGGVIVGKTTTTECGWKAPGDSPLSGTTRNPWNLDLTPGGSSCGAAAAGAAGFGVLHVGTDAGGSVRLPAAWSGLVGLKPTPGRIPQWPLGAFSNVACAGPMARTAEDVSLFLKVLESPDLRDPFSQVPPGPKSDSRVIKGLRIASVGLKAYANLDESVHAAMSDAVAALIDLGAEVEEVSLSLFDLQEQFDQQWGIACARFADQFSMDGRSALDPGLRMLAEYYRDATARQSLDYEVAAAHFSHRMSLLFKDFEVLLCPCTSSPPPRTEQIFASAAEAKWSRWGHWTIPFNVSRQPAISVPIGTDMRGLPRSVQIVTPRWTDERAVWIAQCLQSRFPALIAPLAGGATPFGT
jgi:aspartyl-tRNA(Asn)/glutamyl-tRNA(Gln) amidotransferase subunit A